MGKLTTGIEGKNWLSCNASKAYVQRIRSRCDCILVGKETVSVDNPKLTNRLGRGSNPTRAFVSSNGFFSNNYFLFDGSAKTICLTANKSYPGDKIICNLDKSGRIDLDDALTKLYQLGIRNLLCEGGAAISASLIKENLVDNLILILTPILGTKDAVAFETDYANNFSLMHNRRSGTDIIAFYKKLTY